MPFISVNNVSTNCVYRLNLAIVGAFQEVDKGVVLTFPAWALLNVLDRTEGEGWEVWDEGEGGYRLVFYDYHPHYPKIKEFFSL